MSPPNPDDLQKTARWLRNYAKRKVVRHQGGNLWGINRNRCTIIQPEMLQALLSTGHAESVGSRAFRMTEGSL